MRCRAKVFEAAMTTLSRLRLSSTCCLSNMSLALVPPALLRRRRDCLQSLPICRWPHLALKIRAEHTASSSQQTTDLNGEDWDDRDLSQEVLRMGDSGTAVAAKEETASVTASDDEWYRIQAEDDDWFRKEEQFYEARVSEQEEWARPHIARPEAQPDYLRLSESSLFSQCRMDTFRASGPGGQHRNKTDSGVRLTHLPTGAVAQAVDDRSQHKNRAVAMSRLRILIASKVRRPVKLQGYKPPPELLRLLPPEPGKKASGDKIGVNHPDFAKGIQALLDLLSASKGYVFYASTLLRVSPNVLSKILTMDKTVLQATNELLISKGQKPFK